MLCGKCFEAGQHSGHRFSRIHSGGGNCDCGNPLAIKKMGFCKAHSGTLEMPEVSPLELKEFQFLISHLFIWMCRLEKLNKKSFERLATAVINYLTALNHESLIYNLLTDHLLVGPFEEGSEELLVDWLFCIKEDNIARQLCDLFFNMFSVDKFKYHLAVSFTRAYNSNPRFKNSGFHCLFIQLFANDWLVLDVCQNTQTVPNPKKGDNSMQFYEDFSFMSSVKLEAALKYYQTYFKHNPVVPFDFLDRLEQQLELEAHMHLVDTVTSNINEENYYYYIFCNLLNKIRSDSALSTQILRDLFLQVGGTNHSYIKNHAILPFHRVIAIGLFSLMDGAIEDLSLSLLSQKLGLEEDFLLKFVRTNYERVLMCLYDFAETFVKRNYFDNYLPLYIRSGRTCSNYDYLFIKQMAIILQKLGISTQDILLSIVDQKLTSLPQVQSQ